MTRIGFGNWSLRKAGRNGNASATAFQPSHYTVTRRQRSRYTIRLWSVRHSRFLERLYNLFADLFLKLHPVWKALGYNRVERPVTFVERNVKGLLFDCRMCGRCILSSTGMSCPMNCPKQLRNGPCGGVRANGHCEVEPKMPCVWVQAWNGSRQMEGGDAILNVQKPVDQSLQETSAWLRVTAEAASEAQAAKVAGKEGAA
ncbi:MAG TPA: methylenetetrahydrofolate reductase C-terminal domain-containing protein [Afifellaceae bacterium]|nr:methylenetetrahydrofolate reductase C-terminal domain-containing protein [Afifellaceae bacterium]